MHPPDETPFGDLPAALIEEMMDKSAAMGSELLEEFTRLRLERDARRQQLMSENLVLYEAELGYPPVPTTCATDGSYNVERLLTVDLAAAAAVAVEGLTPPSEHRYWEETRHSTFFVAEVHNVDTATVLRAVMIGMEVALAVHAPHDVVMFDGTLTLPIIFFNQALSQSAQMPSLQCSQEFTTRAIEFLEAYKTMLRPGRTDKNYVGFPKYSTRREIGSRMNWPGEHDDRGMLSRLLQPGELTKPQRIEAPASEWHLGTSHLPSRTHPHVDELARAIALSLADVHVFYYKPHQWMPALRVEVSRDIALNSARLATIVQGIKHQAAVPGMLEPYPIYMADRMAKSLSRAMPTFRQVVTQHIAAEYEGDISDVFESMHAYRS